MAETGNKGPWTAEERAWLADRMPAGKTYAEIADLCGRSMKSVTTTGQRIGGFSALLPDGSKRREEDDGRMKTSTSPR